MEVKQSYISQYVVCQSGVERTSQVGKEKETSSRQPPASREAFRLYGEVDIVLLSPINSSPNSLVEIH
jgi:hypothetical protein